MDNKMVEKAAKDIHNGFRNLSWGGDLWERLQPQHHEDRIAVVQAAIAAQTPQWSDSTPTEAGWYWWRASPTSRNDPYMRKVYDHKWMMHNDGQPTLTAKVGGQWAKATPPASKGE